MDILEEELMTPLSLEDFHSFDPCEVHSILNDRFTEVISAGLLHYSRMTTFDELREDSRGKMVKLDVDLKNLEVQNSTLNGQGTEVADQISQLKKDRNRLELIEQKCLIVCRALQRERKAFRFSQAELEYWAFNDYESPPCTPRIPIKRPLSDHETPAEPTKRAKIDIAIDAEAEAELGPEIHKPRRNPMRGVRRGLTTVLPTRSRAFPTAGKSDVAPTVDSSP